MTTSKFASIAHVETLFIRMLFDFEDFMKTELVVQHNFLRMGLRLPTKFNFCTLPETVRKEKIRFRFGYVFSTFSG